MASSETTTDHQTIQRWAEARDGVPTRIADTGDGSGEGVLRIHFPEASDGDDEFEEIGWDKWFETFEASELALLHSTKDDSTFCKLVER